MKTAVKQVEHASQLSGDKMFFPEGIIGFDNYKEYKIIKEKSKEPFFWLESQDNSEVNFIIINPREFKQDYQPLISTLDKKALQVTNEDECYSYVIISVLADSEHISANLLAPLMVNKEKNICRPR